MSNIVNTVVKDNTYLELTKISLNQLWEKSDDALLELNTQTYLIYYEMRKLLNDTATMHKFEWVDTGKYLPSHLWIDSKSDSATYFKLKYEI